MSVEGQPVRKNKKGGNRKRKLHGIDNVARAKRLTVHNKKRKKAEAEQAEAERKKAEAELGRVCNFVVSHPLPLFCDMIDYCSNIFLYIDFSVCFVTTTRLIQERYNVIVRRVLVPVNNCVNTSPVDHMSRPGVNTGRHRHWFVNRYRNFEPRT